MTQILTWIFFSFFVMTSFQAQAAGLGEELRWEGYQRRQERRLTHALAKMDVRTGAAERGIASKELALEQRRIALEEQKYKDAQAEKRRVGEKTAKKKQKLIEDNKLASTFLSSWRKALEADPSYDADQFIRTQISHASRATGMEGKGMSSQIFTPETLSQIIRRKTQADAVMDKVRSGLSGGAYDFVEAYKQDLEQRIKRGYAGFGRCFIEGFQKLDEERRKESERKRQENIRRTRLAKERKAREEKEKAARIKQEKIDQQRAKVRAIDDEIARKGRELEERRLRAIGETDLSREELDRRVAEKREKGRKNEEALVFLRAWHEECKVSSKRVDRLMIDADAAATKARKQGVFLEEGLVEKILERKRRADEAMRRVREDLRKGKFRGDLSYEAQMQERLDRGYVGFSERFVTEVVGAVKPKEKPRKLKEGANSHDHRHTHRSHHRHRMTPQETVDAALEIVGPSHGDLSMTDCQKDFYGTLQLEGYEITDEVLSLAKAVLSEANRQ